MLFQRQVHVAVAVTPGERRELVVVVVRAFRIVEHERLPQADLDEAGPRRAARAARVAPSREGIYTPARVAPGPKRPRVAVHGRDDAARRRVRGAPRLLVVVRRRGPLYERGRVERGLQKTVHRLRGPDVSYIPQCRRAAALERVEARDHDDGDPPRSFTLAVDAHVTQESGEFARAAHDCGPERAQQHRGEEAGLVVLRRRPLHH